MCTIITNIIKFDAEAISDKIEELVALTKTVNARRKDIESTTPISQSGGVLQSIMS